MDLEQDLLDAHNAREDVREADEWKRKKADHQRYENAAREAHKVRNSARLLVVNALVIDWDGIQLSSKNHFIADAENVAENPLITAAELNEVYKERLISWGDTDNPDLGVGDENALIYQVIEEMVLKRLKEYFADPLNSSIPT